jgi:outer membrane protein assembly factor BamB
VNALGVSGKTVVVGGDFTAVGGVFRDGLAAIDLATGRPTSWFPRVSSSERPQPGIDAMALSGSTLYVGGDFTSVGGHPRTHVAALSTATGRVLGWAPQIKTDQVLAVLLGGSNVYFGGFDVASSYDTAGKLRWNSPPGGIDAVVDAMAASGGVVYAGGQFSVIGGANRTALVGLDARNGSTTAWNPRVTESDGDEEVSALALDGSTLLVGGVFTSAGGLKRDLLAAFDTTSGKVTSWAPKPGALAHVYALAATPNAVYAAGDGGAVAFDPRTGATLPWRPKLSVGGDFDIPFAHAIAVAGSTVYVGDEAGLEAFSR